MANHLADAQSLYLRQHASNPVDWFAWGDAAFDEARRRDVPIFLSLGYSSCHWCHVMAEESFADPAIAAVINESFVAVKVDREEHPGVDALFMTVTQSLTGRGGWPNTVFLTPEGLPFFAGTYFPPTSRNDQPGLPELLEALSDAWRTRRDEVVVSADQIASQVAGFDLVARADSAPDVWVTTEHLLADYDPMHGGFGTAPKFPSPTVLDALLVKGEPSGLDVCQWTLERMTRGGIHDQVGGGFHRYSVDSGWAVPHFEKMLYDNALLLGTFARCWRRTADHDGNRRALFERAIYGIVEWLDRDMRLPGGAFAASLDADSCDAHGRVHEGIYYVWNPALLADALGDDDASWARQVFHVHDAGTFDHGLSTLQLHGDPDPTRLDRVLETLRAERETRFAPSRDDKVVAAWNGLLIDSLVTAGMIFGQQDWLDTARAAADYLIDVHVTDTRLARMSLDGVAGADGVAEDYAGVALGLARLSGAVGEQHYLDTAVALLDAAIERFSADDGGFVDGPKVVFATPRDLTDNPVPSASSILIVALRLAGLLSGRGDFVERADRAQATLWGTVADLPRHAGWGFADVIESDDARKGLGRALVAVVDAGPADRLAQAAWRMAPSGSAIVAAPAGADGFGGALRGLDPASGPYVVVRRGDRISAPITDYAELKTALWARG